MNKYFDPCQNDRTDHRKHGHVAQETERHHPVDINNERKCPEPINWKQERVRKTVDNLLKNITPSRCCMQCPDQGRTVPCDTFKFLLKFVQDGGPLCQQSDRDYEQKIVDEIKRRMSLGLCGNVPLAVPPVLDYVKVPKKRTKEKKVIKKKEKVEKPKPVKPKPVVKPPKPKPKPGRTGIVFLTPKDFKIDDTPASPGTIQYRLSDREFIKKGWTKIPPSLENKYKTFYTFQTNPCGPLLETIWKKQQSHRFYPDGRKMATIEKDGTIKVFYPNCENDLAIHLTPYYENDYRIVVYFNKEEYLNDRHNHLKRKDLPAALFDSYGNGVVYNTKGQIRLKYDQAEGKFFDIPSYKACVCPNNTIHPPIHWKWQDYEEITRRRKMLHHETYGCPNVEKTCPNMTPYLPKQRTPPEIEHPKPKFDHHSREGHHDKTNNKQVTGANKVMAKQSKADQYDKSRTISPHSQKMKGKSKERVGQEPERFEMCASELKLQDPSFVKLKEEDKLQTPIRIVLRIENGITLVIMNQCHIHLEFKAFRQHLKFNLGVRVLFTKDPKFTDMLLSESQPRSMTPPPDMFRAYEHRSPSLQDLFRPQNLLLGKDNVSSHSSKPNNLVCYRPTPQLPENTECTEFRTPRKSILNCELKEGETRPRLWLKENYYQYENK